MLPPLTVSDVKPPSEELSLPGQRDHAGRPQAELGRSQEGPKEGAPALAGDVD